MATRTRYLLTYDIREPRRLRRVHSVAKDFGEPLQYSVFVCDLTEVELLDLKSELLEEVNTREDSVAVFDLGAPGLAGSSLSTSSASRGRFRTRRRAYGRRGAPALAPPPGALARKVAAYTAVHAQRCQRATG